MDKDGRKQENTEQVRSLVLKFLPKIRLCVTLNANAFGKLNTAPELLILKGGVRMCVCNGHTRIARRNFLLTITKRIFSSTWRVEFVFEFFLFR